MKSTLIISSNKNITNSENKINWLRNNLRRQENMNILTCRELESLYYFSRGFTIKQTAAEMCLSPRTAEIHLRNLKTKLNIYMKSDLIKLVIQN